MSDRFRVRIWCSDDDDCPTEWICGRQTDPRLGWAMSDRSSDALEFGSFSDAVAAGDVTADSPIQATIERYDETSSWGWVDIPGYEIWYEGNGAVWRPKEQA